MKKHKLLSIACFLFLTIGCDSTGGSSETTKETPLHTVNPPSKDREGIQYQNPISVEKIREAGKEALDTLGIRMERFWDTVKVKAPVVWQKTKERSKRLWKETKEKYNKWRTKEKKSE